MPRIEVIYVEGCPGAQAAVELVRGVANELSPESTVRTLTIVDEQQARRLAPGGPLAVRVDGEEIWVLPGAGAGQSAGAGAGQSAGAGAGQSAGAGAGQSAGAGAGESAGAGAAGSASQGGEELAGPEHGGRVGETTGRTARAARGDGGIPPRWLVEVGLLRALRPQGLLFLCVANSARSQLGEAVARQLLRDRQIRVQSAGSIPTSVRPETTRVLDEASIDSSGLHSKGVDTIDPATVDTVITLCDEEVCPVFLGRARRLHWGLPDPAGAKGGDEARLQAFRDVRDELLRRLRLLVR